MINHNKSCLKNGNTKDIMSEEVIIGNMFAFQFAGYDTSLLASTTGITLMSHKFMGWFQKIRDDGVEGIDQLCSNKSLENYIKEVLRLYNPAGAALGRILVKDTKICGVPLEKGNRIMIPVLAKYILC